MVRDTTTAGKPPAATDGKSDAAPRKRTGLFEFVQQVRQETAKVTWPTRKETIVTTIMVVLLAIVAAIFFFLVDQVIGMVISTVLSIK